MLLSRDIPDSPLETNPSRHVPGAFRFTVIGSPIQASKLLEKINIFFVFAKTIFTGSPGHLLRWGGLQLLCGLLPRM
jgi:hypothetical protein